MVISGRFFQLSSDDQGKIGVQFDPKGRSRYSADYALIGPYGLTSAGQTSAAGNAVRIRGSKYCCSGAQKGGYEGPWDHAENLPSSGSIGQSFTVPDGGGWLYEAWALLTCSGVKDSSVRICLRRNGPSGELLAERIVKPLPEQSMVRIQLTKPEPPGMYYLEVGDKQGAAYWWGCNYDAYADGTAFFNGAAQPSKDMVFGYTLADVGVMDWGVRTDADKLICTYELRQQAISGFTPSLSISFPFERDGYDTTNLALTPFRFLITDSGCWFPIEAFKRNESDWNLKRAGKGARLCGTRAYDLTITHQRSGLEPHMEPSRLHLLLGNEATVQVSAKSDKLPDIFPRFFVSDRRISDILDRFMKTFLFWNTSCPSTYEFDALKLSWVGGPAHDGFRNVVEYFTNRCDDDGYIWSRPNSRGWNGDSPTNDTRHFDNNCPFILACWDLYVWSGDREWLSRVMPTVRKAVNYLLHGMDGKRGVLTIDAPQHSGITEPKGNTNPSNYFDCIPTGYRDAYINAFFAASLRAAADLERAAGDAHRAGELDAYAMVAKRAFNRVFWDDAKGRYISWVDANGQRHDSGMSYVNTIAATYGLADKQQVVRMYRWMQTEPTSSGKADTFSRWVFAPRSNAIHCSEQANALKYDEWCEDGGALLWTAYYEIMSRVNHLGADNAWHRFKQILERYNKPDKLVGGNPMYYGEIDNRGDGVYGPGSVGLWGEFPESGLAPCAFLYGFVGVRADHAGLYIKPNLPTELQYAGVENLVYCGKRMKITVYRNRVVLEWDGRRMERGAAPGKGITFTKDVFK